MAKIQQQHHHQYLATKNNKMQTAISHDNQQREQQQQQQRRHSQHQTRRPSRCGGAIPAAAPAHNCVRRWQHCAELGWRAVHHKQHFCGSEIRKRRYECKRCRECKRHRTGAGSSIDAPSVVVAAAPWRVSGRPCCGRAHSATGSVHS